MALIVVDRTRIETDWKCARKRYWLTEYDGYGIVQARAATALNFGIAVHEGLEIVTEYDIGGAQAAIEHLENLAEWGELSTEHQQLCKVLLWGFAKAVWP